MTHETVDDTLDRVAGEMTAVADNPMLSTRVRERMHRRARPWLLPALVAGSVAGVVALSVVLSHLDGQSAGAEVHEVSGRTLAPVAPLAVSVPPADLSWTHSLAVPSAAIVSVDETPLAVAALVIAPLAMPEVAEIEPLRVASLQIADIEFEEPKEPK
jgi:hypothetical protein